MSFAQKVDFASICCARQFRRAHYVVVTLEFLCKTVEMGRPLSDERIATIIGPLVRLARQVERCFFNLHGLVDDFRLLFSVFSA